jgi:hypothetical protein
MSRIEFTYRMPSPDGEGYIGPDFNVIVEADASLSFSEPEIEFHAIYMDCWKHDQAGRLVNLGETDLLTHPDLAMRKLGCDIASAFEGSPQADALIEAAGIYHVSRGGVDPAAHYRQRETA